MSKEKRVGNIGEQEYKECVKYFQIYWNYFKQNNSDWIETQEQEEYWADIYFMVFLSGFSAGISVGEQHKQTLMEEIIQSN